MQEKSRKNYQKSVLSPEPYNRRSQTEMIRIVKEIQSGIIAKRTACVNMGLKVTHCRFLSGSIRFVNLVMNYPLNYLPI